MRWLRQLHRWGVPPWFDYGVVEFSSNVILFIPLGALVAIILGLRLWWGGAVAGFMLSVVIELARWRSCRRAFPPSPTSPRTRSAPWPARSRPGCSWHAVRLCDPDVHHVPCEQGPTGGKRNYADFGNWLRLSGRGPCRMHGKAGSRRRRNRRRRTQGGTASAGHAPFYEPVLDELLSELEESGRLRFTTDMAAARGAEVHFICVGTPQKKGENGADLRYVDAAVASLADTSPPATSSPGNPRCLWEPPRGWPKCWPRRRARRHRWSGIPSSCAKATP